MTRSFDIWAIVTIASVAAVLIASWAPARLLRQLEIPQPTRFWHASLAVACLTTTQLAHSTLSPQTLIGSAALGLLVSASVAIAWYDASYLIIPDILTFGLVLAALGISHDDGLNLSLWGGGLCAGLLFGLSIVWRAVKGEDAMGFGDVKLAGAYGLMLGPEHGAWMLAASACSGAVWALAVQRLQPNRLMPVIPFGLFLSICGLALIIARLV